MKRTFTWLFVLLTVAGCSKSVLPTDPLRSGKLVITVRETSTGAGFSGVLIEVRQNQNGPVLVNGQTTDTGLSEIAVPAGAYYVHPVAPTGYRFGDGPAEFLGASVSVGSGGTATVAVSIARI